MKTKYDNNPLYILKTKLQYYIHYGVINDNPDAVIDAILLNNHYTFSENKKSDTVELFDGFYIYFVSGASNEDCNFYDYVSAYGSKYLIILLDYFDIVNKNRNEGNDYVYSWNNILGLSNQFSALNTIVEVFISLIEPYIKILTGTIQGNIYVHAGSYIAGAILASSKCGFEESDIYGNSIPYDKIIETISSKNLQYVLMGIE